MKTGKELILELPNGVRRNFILELSRYRSKESAEMFLSKQFRDIKDVIRHGFIWDDTNRGYGYWMKIHATYA